jgi:hypothetical protein
MKTAKFALALAIAASFVGFNAEAGPLNSPVPTSATITFAGLQWAWGGPCAYSNPTCGGDLSYQGTQGWTLPTAADMALVDAYDSSNPAAFADLFAYPGANVPYLGTDPISGAFDSGAGLDGLPATDLACASGYFAVTGFGYCDGGDAVLGAWYGSAIGSNPSFFTLNEEQLYVRAIPEPLTLSLLGAGLAGAVAMRRRKKA